MRLLRLLAELLYPRGVRCLACGGMSHGDMLCDACAHDMEVCRLRPPLCPVCGYPVRRDGCAFCRRNGAISARSVWRHEGAPAQLVRALKFHALRDAAPTLVDGMAACASELLGHTRATVTWVPMPRRRMLARGVDHARLLAEGVAERLQLPCEPLLDRTRTPHLTQRSSDRAGRIRNAAHAYTCGHAEGAVLLIDDVLTTGSTARSCCLSLLEGGAQCVYVVTATRSVRQGDGGKEGQHHVSGKAGPSARF